MASDESIRAEIDKAITEEHELRSNLEAGKITSDAERARIQQLEGHLDQLWDLLRRRRATRDAGGAGQETTLRSVEQIEGYDDSTYVDPDADPTDS